MPLASPSPPNHPLSPRRSIRAALQDILQPDPRPVRRCVPLACPEPREGGRITREIKQRVGEHQRKEWAIYGPATGGGSKQRGRSRSSGALELRPSLATLVGRLAVQFISTPVRVKCGFFQSPSDPRVRMPASAGLWGRARGPSDTGPALSSLCLDALDFRSGREKDKFLYSL